MHASSDTAYTSSQPGFAAAALILAYFVASSSACNTSLVRSMHLPRLLPRQMLGLLARKEQPHSGKRFASTM